MRRKPSFNLCENPGLPRERRAVSYGWAAAAADPRIIRRRSHRYHSKLNPPRIPPAPSSHKGFHRARSISAAAAAVIASPLQLGLAVRDRTHPLAMISPIVTGTIPRLTINRHDAS